MEVLLNDNAIKSQFTEESFLEYMKDEIVPILGLLSENNLELLKKTTTYNCKITPQKTFCEFLYQKGNPVIDSFKAKLAQLTNDPFWDVCTKTKMVSNTVYLCDIDEIPNCITEAFERSALIFSFINGGYDNDDIQISCNGEVSKVSNFVCLSKLKELLAELGIITLWKSNSFEVPSIGYKFEVRFDEQNHGRAHFHLSKGDEAASISIPDADILAGGLSKQGKAISWSLQNMEKIVDLWNRFHPEKKVSFPKRR